MLNIQPPPFLPRYALHRLHSLSFSPWLCSRFVRQNGAGQGEAQAQQWLMYDFWRGNAAQAMRECGNVRMAGCPSGPAHSALCLEAAFLLAPGGRGMKEGTGGVGEWTQASDQTAERQWRVVAVVGGCAMSAEPTGRF